MIKSFPDYSIKDILNLNKSHLSINGNTYLWRVQQIQVELLKEFDRICRKYNLKYNISFGTLLGAVRHQGFIPWDDDLDIGMTRDNYNKFLKVIQNDLSDKFYYLSNISHTSVEQIALAFSVDEPFPKPFLSRLGILGAWHNNLP